MKLSPILILVLFVSFQTFHFSSCGSSGVGEAAEAGELIESDVSSKTCPDKMSSVFGAFCIDNGEQPTVEQFPQAALTCTKKGKALCEPQQWIATCIAQEDGDLAKVQGLLQLDSWEWTSNVNWNGKNGNRAIQAGGGESGSCHTIRHEFMNSNGPYTFRCCKNL
jgi:hypothetical protein